MGGWEEEGARGLVGGGVGEGVRVCQLLYRLPLPCAMLGVGWNLGRDDEFRALVRN